MIDATIASVLIAGIVALPPTIISIATFLTSRAAAVAANTASEAAQKAASTAANTSTDLAVKAEQIHVLVNSNLSSVKQDLEEAKNTIASLKLLVETLSGDSMEKEVKEASDRKPSKPRRRK